MADRKDIISLPDKRLRERSKKVGLIDDDVKQLIQDMKDATLDWEDHREHEFGVALAAVQIGVMQRVVVVRNNMEDKNDRSFVVLINPIITKELGELVEDYEGCLSVPDAYGKVLRYSKVKVKALNEAGREVRITCEGFLARVMQHEIDHTNGTVFIDHIKDEPEAFFKLSSEGKLEPQDYDKDIRNNRIYWQ